jgi:hypothetical protein
MKILDAIGYPSLVAITLFLGLAPMRPEPHLWEKLKMLTAGTLSKPIDIFDLVMHGTPLGLLCLKIVWDLRQKH